MNYLDHKKELEQNPEYQKALEEAKFQFALGDAIIEARLKKGWSQSKLAKEVGTNQANISRIEAAVANPTLKVIQKICRALDIDMYFNSSVPCEETPQYSTKTETGLPIPVPNWPGGQHGVNSNSDVGNTNWGKDD